MHGVGGRASPGPSNEPPAVSAAQATALLKYGMERAARPVDGVIERLRASGGATWAERRVREVLRGSLAASTSEIDDLLGGRVSLEDLERVKSWCKRTVARCPSESDDSRGALLGYFLVLASASAHFGACLTERGKGEVSEALVDLSEALPASWRGVARSGAERLI